MPDIASIGVMLGSVKSALEIVKYLNQAGASLEAADLKLKLADLAGMLADAKLEIIAVQEILLEKERIISELNEAFENKGALHRVNDAYYKIGADGKPTGVAYCLRCYENDHKLRQLVDTAGPIRMRACSTCGQKYDRGRTWDAGG